MDRARPDDHQQPVVLAVHDVADLPASVCDPPDRFVPGVNLLHQDGRRDQWAQVVDPDVVGRWAEHESRISSMEAHSRPA
jgi:hypothetical protein